MNAAVILAIRTDKPEAEIGLFDGKKQLAYETWTAHRQLAETIHIKIEELLKSHGKTRKDLEGIVCFKGPGSFTGLRIGLGVANALTFGLKVPIITAQGKRWAQEGVKKLQNGEDEKVAIPEYGSPIHTTTPTK